MSIMTDSCEDLSMNSRNDDDEKAGNLLKTKPTKNNNFSALSKVIEPLGANKSKLLLHAISL